MAGVDFQAQISSIMEMLASAAVAEICKVMDDGCAVLQLEISQSLKENELLRRKIRVMERALLHRDSETSGVSVLKRAASTDNSAVQTDHSISAGPAGSSDIKNEPTDEEEEPDVLIVKEEKLQKVCSFSSNKKSAAPDCQIVCSTETGGSSDSEPRKRRRRSEEVKMNAESVMLHTGSVDVINEEAEQSEDVDVQAACGGAETTETAFRQNHYEFLSAHESCSSTDVKPDFLIIGPGPANEELHGQVEQRGTEELVCLQPGFPYPSEKCSLGFADSFSGTSGDHVTWMCDQQDSPDEANLHILHGDALWNCSLCGKHFSHVMQLKLHERVHTKEKIYRCSRCGRQFPQLCRLKRHERVHTGEKPFRCAKCGKHFAQANNLKVHQSVHTGERRFSCVQCGKSFSFLSNLIRHKAVHTGK